MLTLNVNARHLVLLSLIAYALAIKCYNGFTTDDEKASESVLCPYSKYCIKTTMQVYDEKVNTYRCDTNLCRKDGCLKGMNGVDNCCCSTDLCNNM